MSALLTSTAIDAITLFTGDLERSKAFYQDVFGLPVYFEDDNSAVFKLDNTLINLLKTTASPCSTARWTGPGASARPASPTRAATSGRSPPPFPAPDRFSFALPTIPVHFPFI